ncbi:MAG: hypothetical protein HY552_04085 [Elusimicrobia bacterium]|nr:hypothetical protein [Elusimicrobiota bacterium]
MKNQVETAYCCQLSEKWPDKDNTKENKDGKDEAEKRDAYSASLGIRMESAPIVFELAPVGGGRLA